MFKKVKAFRTRHENGAHYEAYTPLGYWKDPAQTGHLLDETYIGHSIHNKQASVSFKCKKRVNKPKDEWWKVEDTHEAIISKFVGKID